MKILILSQYYDPEPVPIPGQMARGLRARGHEVQVLTAAPSYPAGRIYGGFSNGRSTVDQAGIIVHRVATVISHSQSAIGRLSSYATFALSASTSAALIRGADVVYVYATQMTAAIPADLWSMVRGAPFVLHVQDLWPESITESSMVPPIAQRAIGGILTPWLNQVYYRASSIVAIAPTMADVLGDRASSRDKVHTVFNWTVEDERHIVPRSQRPGMRGVNLLYAGNVGALQGLDTVVDALACTDDAIRLRIVGTGSHLAHITSRASKLIEAGRVELHQPVSRNQLKPHLDWADFQLVPLRNLEIFRGTIPSKFQGSMREGIPVITNVPGDLSELIHHHGVGLTARPGDVSSFAETLAEAAELSDEQYAALSHRSLDLYTSKMSETSAIDRMEAILTSAANATRRRKNSG